MQGHGRQGRLDFELNTTNTRKIAAGAKSYVVQVLAGRAYQERGTSKSELRMVRPPRAVRGEDGLRRQIQDLEAENERLRSEPTNGKLD